MVAPSESDAPDEPLAFGHGIVLDKGHQTRHHLWRSRRRWAQQWSRSRSVRIAAEHGGSHEGDATFNGLAAHEIHLGGWSEAPGKGDQSAAEEGPSLSPALVQGKEADLHHQLGLAHQVLKNIDAAVRRAHAP